MAGTDKLDDHRQLQMQYTVLKNTFAEYKRVAKFQRNWLKKHHPLIYNTVMEASEQNDKLYLARCFKQFHAALKRDFGNDVDNIFSDPCE